MSLLPPIKPAFPSAVHPVTKKSFEAGDWVYVKMKRNEELIKKGSSFCVEKRKSVAVAFRYGNGYREPTVLVIHETPRLKRKHHRYGNSPRGYISVEWVRLAIVEFVCKGAVEEFLTHPNDYIRYYFELVVKKGTKIVTVDLKNAEEVFYEQFSNDRSPAV